MVIARLPDDLSDSTMITVDANERLTFPFLSTTQHLESKRDGATLHGDSSFLLILSRVHESDLAR